MNKELLKNILSIQSESYNQFRVFAYIIKMCNTNGWDYSVSDGNIYVTKGTSSKIYPCIIAHMDTVHDICEDLTIVQVGDNLTGFNSVLMEQTGCGGDDKVGIFLAISCLLKYDNIKAAFFRDEEVGCDGSYLADMEFFKNCSFVLQGDRRGNSDFITTASGVKLSSSDFQTAIKPILKQYGYKFNNGAMTDVMALKEIGLQVSCANVSCGYYNPHSSREYVNISDVNNCLQLFYAIIDAMGWSKWKHKPLSTYKPYGRYNWEFNEWEKQDVKWKMPKVEKEVYMCEDCRNAPAVRHGLCSVCLEYYKNEYNFYL